MEEGGRERGKGPLGAYLHYLSASLAGGAGGTEVDGAVEQGERVTALSERGRGERMGMGTATPLSLNDACSAAGPPHNAFSTSYPVKPSSKARFYQLMSIKFKFRSE